ncbi:M6 family metalloprotease domain-containing protein [Longimicrobium sp.]|uniref:M6 family metalloprotease domain-containing protein n=1 Tax=Longimicrobium sp. TaxID=2029185 RepID=UPI003B3B042C
MTTRKTALLAALGTMAVLGGWRPAAAQDIEAQAHARGITLPRAYYERVARDPDFFELRHGWRNRAPAGRASTPGGISAAVLPGQGNLRMVVVMTLFSGSPQPPFSTETTHQQLFGQNPLGNLTDFYREISGARVTITGNVLSWTRTGVTLSEAVGTSMGLGEEAKIGEYMVSALERVDGNVNFGQFDNDGPDGVPNSGDDDGYVDVAVFQYTEVAASCGGPGPWPHRSTVAGWTGQPYSSDDRRPNGQPVMVNDYIMQSVVDCDGEPQTISTIAHETGHAFGLPDFYDPTAGILPSQRRWVLGCWTLMAAGSWGCGDGASMGKVQKPSHMGAYEKGQLGWIDEVEASTVVGGTYTLPPVQVSGKSLRIPLRGTTEYLLLEYRPNTGYDSGLPAGGVLMYHVDTSLPMRPCATCARKYRVGLVEADGNGTLVKMATEGGNRGEAGDVFTGTRVLTDATTPSLRLTSGAASNLVLTITVQDGQARVQVARRLELTLTQVMGPYMGGAALSAEEQASVDAVGNANGRFDLGDVRAFLRTAPAGE